MSAMQSGIQDDIWIQEDIAKTSGLSGLEADQHFFNIQQSLLDGATVVLIIILVDKTQLSLILGDVAAWLVYVTIENLSREAQRRRSIPGTLLAGFIPITKIRDLFLKTLENAAKSGILLACVDGRTRQCYLTICAILRCLDKGHDDFVHLVDCFGWKHYNFNIHVSLATDTLHLLLKGLVMKMLDFMQDMLDDIYPGSRKTWDNSTTLVTQESEQKAIIQQLVAVVSPLFVSKAPFALHFICAVCDLVTLAQYKSHDEDTLAYIQGALERMNVFKEEFRHALTHIIQDIRMYGALDSICTGANSEAHHITIVKQFYSMTNKKEYILQIYCTYSTRVTRSLPFRRLGWSIPGIQPHSTKLLLSEVAANIAISDFTYAAAVFVGRMSVQIHPSIKCWRSSGKRHNDPEHCDEEVIDNTTGMLSVRRRAWNAASKRRILQAFKFYDLSTIIRLVHLVLRDLPDLITRTTMSYYVNNYIDWDEYNRLYSPIFDIDLLRTLREYRRKRTRNN
ncbi:hypothetical protein HBI64_254560 [Parastagonospora nodorum]|nr:hypothetical protein HBI64_254560 [Parastagonospora nodorum]